MAGGSRQVLGYLNAFLWAGAAAAVLLADPAYVWIFIVGGLAVNIAAAMGFE